MFSWLSPGRGGRRVVVLLAALVFLGVAVAPASAQAQKRVVKVMTYNMDAGTDFLYFLYGPDLGTAFLQTYAELQAANFEGRANRMADMLASEMPYVVALEEVTLWEWVDNRGVPQLPIADQLQLLKQAIRAKKLPYKVVTVQRLTNLYLPIEAMGMVFHFLDMNVLLVRTDLSQAELDVSNVQQARYAASVEPIPGFVEVNGWLSADLKIRGKNVRLFGTHLASATSALDPLQPAQGAELIEIMSRSPYPVILAGDFNSDMSGLGNFPSDATPTAPNIVAAGYDDVWTEAGHAAYEGLTWPLYWEDFLADTFPNMGPIERIDLIFAKGLEVLDAKTVGTAPVYPSDHVGVVATLLIEK
jgi:endonuclease/exonuclease/phosphatase family metal-dependent hydrolase